MKYPEYVYEAVTQRLDMTNEEVDEMAKDEVFDALVGWKLGYSQWADTIKEWIEDVYKLQLDCVK